MRAIGPCSQSTMLGVLVAAVAGLLLLLLLHGRWFPFLWADLGAFVALVGSSLRCRWRLSRRPPITLLQVFQSHARRRPHHPLLLFQDEVYTFSDMERRSNRAARAFALRLGLQPGQTVAVFLPNVPAYVWTWLALAKLGCAMACLNCNVRGRALLHARSAARADIVLSCSGELGGWGLPRVCVCVCAVVGGCTAWCLSAGRLAFACFGMGLTAGARFPHGDLCTHQRVQEFACVSVCARVCQCVPLPLCVCMAVSVCAWTCTHLYLCMFACMLLSVHVCAWQCPWMDVHMCLCTSAQVLVRGFACMLFSMHGERVHMHRHTCMLVSLHVCTSQHTDLMSMHAFTMHVTICAREQMSAPARAFATCVNQCMFARMLVSTYGFARIPVSVHICRCQCPCTDLYVCISACNPRRISNCMSQCPCKYLHMCWCLCMDLHISVSARVSAHLSVPLHAFAHLTVSVHRLVCMPVAVQICRYNRLHVCQHPCCCMQHRWVGAICARCGSV